ncbi:hypothetical protein LTR10_012281 [Elasticomyces elasticus]|nr:hypothetical protein LTR10_012281 [Elasticomyces elasticus]
MNAPPHPTPPPTSRPPQQRRLPLHPRTLLALPSGVAHALTLLYQRLFFLLELPLLRIGNLVLADLAPAVVGPSGLSQSQRSVRDLAAKCNALATDLAKILDDLKISRKANGKLSVSSAVRQVVRSHVWQKDKKIGAKQAALQQAEGQLAVGLMVLLRNEQHANFRRVETGIEKNNNQLIKAVLDAKDDIMAALRHQQQLLSSDQQPDRQEIRDSQQRVEAYVSENAGRMIELTAVSKAIEESLTTETEQNIATRVTNSLRFSELGVRRDVIEPAAHETFGWSFNYQTPLTVWLKSDDSLFWVTGKAGSGKSTLMKYLASSKQTVALLKDWSNGSRVCVVDVYFWYPGSPMQKSELGLLQTMLSQILDAIPSLTRIVTPRRWKAAHDINYKPELWTREELSEALDIVAGGPFGHEDVRFCLFIDGLDEFHGNHRRLIQQIRRLIASPNVKAIVSSRPWNVFASEFGGLQSQLLLEDLTRPDIVKYINGELGYYLRHNTEGSVLVDDIVEKASGVFLWVYLTVKSLGDGISEDDSLNMLRRRVESYPTDLNEFFILILKRVDPAYRKSTTQALEMAMILTGLDPQDGIEGTFLDYWHLRSERPTPDDPDFALEMKMSECTGRQLRAMTVETRRFLARVTKDLLHLPGRVASEGSASFDAFEPDIWPRVEFLHRTVYDFLSMAEQRELISRDSPDYFKDDSFLCKVVLARLKVVPQEIENVGAYWTRHAAWVLDRPFLEHEFVASLEEVAMLYMEQYPFHWIAEKTDIILESFAAFGLLTCVKAALTARPGSAQPVKRKLLMATMGFSNYNLFPINMIDPEGLKAVLSMGTDPNMPIADGETIWDRFLSRWRTLVLFPTRGSRLEDVWHLARILIDHGADVNAVHSKVSIALLEGRMPSSLQMEIRGVLQRNRRPVEEPSSHAGASPGNLDSWGRRS